MYCIIVLVFKVPEGEDSDDEEDYGCFDINEDDEDEDALMPRYYKPSCYNADWIVFARLNVLRRIDLTNLSGEIVKTGNRIGSIAITDRNQIICCESELISFHQHYIACKYPNPSKLLLVFLNLKL
jgi:hypothetical protein